MCRPSPVMVTSPSDWINLEWDNNSKINKLKLKRIAIKGFFGCSLIGICNVHLQSTWRLMKTKMQAFDRRTDERSNSTKSKWFYIWNIINNWRLSLPFIAFHVLFRFQHDDQSESSFWEITISLNYSLYSIKTGI